MLQPLVAILICLALAYVLGEFFRQFGLPRVVGQIGAGLILGVGVIKAFLFSTQSTTTLSFLANLGIILLFYYVGLETNFRAFTRNIKKSVLISLCNTTIPLVLGFIIMRYLLHFDFLTSIIIGVSLCVSAQSVSVDLLEELNMIKSKIGKLIISAGAVDDVIELVLVSVILSILHISLSGLTVTRLLIDIGIFIVFMIVARIWVIPFALKYFDREKSSTARFTGSLLLVLLIASLSEFLGIGSLIGALIAGMIVRQTIYKEKDIPTWEEHDISKSIHIIAFGFLIPLFFVWIGVNTNLVIVAEHLWLILLLFIIASVGTIGGTALAIRLSNGTMRQGLLIGWGLNPKGDIELVIAALALKAGIITSAIFTSLVFMSLLTTIISPIVFDHLLRKRIPAR